MIKGAHKVSHKAEKRINPQRDFPVFGSCSGIRLLTLFTTAAILTVQVSTTSAADVMTDYDRNNSPRPDKAWHAVEADKAPTTINIERLGSETGTPKYKIAPNNASTSEVIDRIKATDGYIEMEARADRQDDTFTEYENRTETLEDLERHWAYDPSLDQFGSWVTTSEIRIEEWADEISGQLTGFEQKAVFRVYQMREVDEYDKNYVDGDERLINTRTENRNFKETRKRWIDVVTGSWKNSGGLHNCSAWTPHPSTVTAGKTFKQERSCSQTQIRNVSYTVASTGKSAGSPWEDTQTLTEIADYKYGVIGTKQTVECRKQGFRFGEAIEDQFTFLEYVWDGKIIDRTLAPIDWSERSRFLKYYIKSTQGKSNGRVIKGYRYWLGDKLPSTLCREKAGG